MEFKCKICAGSLTIEPKSRIAVCDYCGTKQVLPLFSDDSSKNLFERGNQYLLHNEYDKAENIFTQLLSVNPNDGEIYWDLVLCKYGVTYAKDPQTERYIPTCNRTHTDSVFNDENYKKAIDLSSAEKAALYKHDAEIIGKIQKGILELSKKEKPFDIFISYKETDENGNRTKDSIAAQKLYEKLTGLGYKVFFSRITLESKIGEEYEPYIYAALSSSKVMLTVCSSVENIQAAWVKNEWNRFLVLRRGNVSKTLIPIYFDMNTEDLPEEFALLPAQDMNAPDFEQELIRGIKKLIPKPVAQNGEHKKLVLITVSVVAVVVLIMSTFWGVYSYKADKEKKTAEAEAQAQADAAAELKSKYENASSLFASGNYDEAKNIYDELGEYEDAVDKAYKCTYYGAYDDALQLYYDHRYAEATWACKEIGDYEEVNELLEKSKKAWREDLATVAITCMLGSGVEYNGSYYINANGTVNTFSFAPGNSNVEIETDSNGEIIGENALELNEHGKVISIAEGMPLYALHEDGYVSNSAYLNDMDRDWENVIQITGIFNTTSIALLDDGTIAIGNTSANSNGDDDKWLEEVKSWENIVKIDYESSDRFGYGGLGSAIIVALDSEGKVHCVELCDGGYYYAMTVFLNGLSDIKDIQVTWRYVTALREDGTLFIYDIDSHNITQKKGVKYSWDGYYIDSKNELKETFGNKTILSGVVYLSDGFCVSQSGSIYKCDGSSTEAKTEVKDIWLMR